MNLACLLFASVGEAIASFAVTIATAPIDDSDAAEFKSMIGLTLISEFAFNVSAAWAVTNLASALASFNLPGAIGNNS